MNGNNMQRTVFFLLLISTNLYSQNLRISYGYNFIQDSLHTDHISKEIVFLDISEKGSNFYSRSRYLNDSLAFHKNIKTNPHQSKIDFSVKKSASQDVFVNTKIGNSLYSFQEKEKLNWVIFPEKKIIMDMEVQKATLDFGGRKWIAWFTSAIPIQDGPYIFRNLPGLILSIEDEKKQHSFSVIGIERREIPYEIEKPNYKLISKNEFNTRWKAYKKDPNFELKSLSARTNTKFAIEWNGEMISQNEIYKREEERARKEILHNNNFIDLDLYK